MLKKLYQMGCFNYQNFILEHMKELYLSSDEAIVLIKILDGYRTNKSLSSESLISSTSLTKSKVDKSLASLLERSFYEIYINYDHGIGQEYISLDGFFVMVEKILNHKNIDTNDELYAVTQYVTKKMNRILTSKELEILTSLIIEDKYTFKDIEKACDYLKLKSKIITLKNIAQALVVKEEGKPKVTSKVAQDFYNKIK